MQVRANCVSHEGYVGGSRDNAEPDQGLHAKRDEDQKCSDISENVDWLGRYVHNCHKTGVTNLEKRVAHAISGSNQIVSGHRRFRASLEAGPFTVS